MTRLAHRRRSLKAIVAVRRLQHEAAEHKAALAQGEVVRLQEAKDAQEGALVLSTNEWRRTSGSGRIDLAAGQAWLHAIASEEATLQDLHHQRAEAEGVLEARRGDLAIAKSQADLARDLHRRVLRRANHRKEEALLSELSDRYARRGRP